MSRVLIADDHAVVRAGYKQFLEAEAGITAIGETASGNETLDQLRKHEWRSWGQIADEDEMLPG